MPSRISESMIRKRAEHNEGMLSTLEEVALHQQNIEKIELLGQLCPRLKIIYLQNNLISKIQNLHKLKVGRWGLQRDPMQGTGSTQGMLGFRRPTSQLCAQPPAPS